MLFDQYAVLFGMSLAASLIFTMISIGIARRFNFLDHPGTIKQHGRPVPYLGGAAIFGAFWIVLGFVLLLAPRWGGLWGKVLKGLVDDQVSYGGSLGHVFAGGLVILVVGLIDDKRALKPHTKFIGMMAGVAIALAGGTSSGVFGGLGWWGHALDFLWVLTLINSFNFIDSIDGHCGGIALIACLILFTISQIIFQPIIAVVTVILAGAILGFLPFNFSKARTFLGDNGSMFLGYTLAVLSLQATYQAGQPQYITPLFPLFVFGVPIYDLMSVVIVRLYRGVAPWKGDRNHFAHRLIQLGMTRQDAALFSYLVAMTTGLIAILSTQVSSLTGHSCILLIYVFILMVISILEFYAVGRKDIVRIF